MYSIRRIIIFFSIFVCVALPVQAQTFTFGASGDFQSGTNFHATVNTIKTQNPTFTIALGDLAYTAVEQSWCNYWKQTAGYNNILLLAGNHDSGESSAGDINSYAQYCPYTLSSPLTGTYAKQYYFDYPQTTPLARFILISADLGGSYIGFDTNYSTNHQGYTFVQQAIDDARTKNIKWIIVSMHKNCITMGTKSCEIGTDLMNLLLQKKVDIVLQAHDHIYSRSKQLTCVTPNSYNASCITDSGSDGLYQKDNGLIIVINGAGGQGLYDVNTNDSEAGYFAKWMGSNSNPTFGYSHFTVSPTSLSSTFVRSTGGTFTDTFTISSSTLTPTPTTKPGDTNNDGKVNYLDYNTWSLNYARSITNGIDYAIWAQQYFP